MRIGSKIAVMIGVVVSVALVGCSKHKEPPLERLELVSRFFDSVRKRDFETAARQGQKLYAMDRNNEFLLHLITIHESNFFLRQAQKELNSGNVDGALRILAEGSRNYPDNRTLRMYRTRIIQLRNAKSLIGAMKSARGEAAMSAALTAAETGLGTNMSPKLAAYFKSYEAKIKKVSREAEKESRRLGNEKGSKRPDAGKAVAAVPAEPKMKPQPPQSGKGSASQRVTKLKSQESLDRPPPIVLPESENDQ